jgi:hypothetical protein
MLESLTLSERRAWVPHALSNAAYRKLRIRIVVYGFRSDRVGVLSASRAM